MASRVEHKQERRRVKEQQQQPQSLDPDYAQDVSVSAFSYPYAYTNTMQVCTSSSQSQARSYLPSYPDEPSQRTETTASHIQAYDVARYYRQQYHLEYPTYGNKYLTEHGSLKPNDADWVPMTAPAPASIVLPTAGHGYAEFNRQRHLARDRSAKVPAQFSRASTRRNTNAHRSRARGSEVKREEERLGEQASTYSQGGSRRCSSQSPKETTRYEKATKCNTETKVKHSRKDGTRTTVSNNVADIKILNTHNNGNEILKDVESVNEEKALQKVYNGVDDDKLKSVVGERDDAVENEQVDVPVGGLIDDGDSVWGWFVDTETAVLAT